MTTAIPDDDLPGGGGGHCASGETHGYYQELFECRSGNGLYWRLICDDIEVDINPDRVLIKNGTNIEVSISSGGVLVKNGPNVSLEVLPDKIVTKAPLLEHFGNFRIHGQLISAPDVSDPAAVDGVLAP